MNATSDAVVDDPSPTSSPPTPANVTKVKPASGHALEIDALVKSYGDVEVLRDISVAIDEGEFLVLVGPSGCGKSTLLNCIAGLEETTAGRIVIAGRDVTHLPPRDRDIAMVFQSYALYPTMSVADNIAFGMKVRKVPKEEIERKVAEVAKLLQIDAMLDRRPGQLSGGQRQRVAMGRALVREPALFLFDEPLSNLDAKLRVEMRAEIKRVHETTGASIVYVTHDQIEAMTLATRIVVLEGGHVQQIGTPAEIYERPANTFVADFMGSPPMNLVGAIARGDGIEFDGVAVDGIAFDGGVPDRVAPEASASGEGVASHGPTRTDPDATGTGRRLALPVAPPVPDGTGVIVGIRPESFSSGDELHVVPDLVENTGADTFLRFRLAGVHVTARLPGRVGGAVGEEIGLAVDTAALCWFDAESGRRID